MTNRTLIRPGDHRVVPWKNGGGTTREVAVGEPRPGGGFAWRLSLASVAAAGPFSSFPGVDRTILLVSGEGMELRFTDEVPPRVVRVDRPFEPVRFAGETATTCALLGGPVVDLNVMTERARATHALEVVREAGRRAVKVGTIGIAHALAGATWVGGERLAEGETLVVRYHGCVSIAPDAGGATAWILVEPASTARPLAGAAPSD